MKLVAESLTEYQTFTRTGLSGAHKENLRKIGIGGIQPGDLFYVKKPLNTQAAGGRNVEYPVRQGGWSGYARYDKDEILRVVDDVKRLGDNDLEISFVIYRSYHAAVEDRGAPWTTDVRGDWSYLRISQSLFDEHFEEITEKTLPGLLKRLRKMRPNTPEGDL